MSKYTANEISTFLRAANADLGSNKYTGDQMIPDYCKAVIIGQQLQAELDTANKENKRLRDRLDAVEQLAACYRMQRRPTEKLFCLLDKTEQALKDNP
ncbi:hypothetical protein LCGC14_1999290 [marine sediment metagenome]|uniref:Uncharacterized protein n=1 Tax=marine sediment metagenome TaxID=412755 RepID=A0A0F9F3X7_9ZZZZ